MREHQKPQETVQGGPGNLSTSMPNRATTALAEAVAKRTEARKLTRAPQGGAPHGGRPMSNLKVASQTRGKKI